MTPDVLNVIGAVGTIVMGCIGLFLPTRAAAITGLEAKTNAGKSEFRSSYGGLFIALGLIPLLSMAPIAFAVAGSAWLFTGIGRIVSIGLDNVSDRTNWGGVGFELLFAFLLLVGAPGSSLLALF